MSALTPASEVMLRHSDEFIERRVLFAGDLQDSCRPNSSRGLRFDHRSRFRRQLRYAGLLLAEEQAEAQFQLCNILALLPVGVDVFVVGENRSGVRSAEPTLEGHVALVKIDSARRCGLYHGRLDAQTEFDLNDWWDSYQLHDLEVKTLPGVFSRDGLDVGSSLLLSTLEKHMKGKVLDIGCGAGVMASVMAKLSPKVKLTLSDVNAAAVESSRATLAANGIEGEVIVSNVYSDITGRFDMIISNPPFHDGLQTSLTAAETLIRGAVKHLPIGASCASSPTPSCHTRTFWTPPSAATSAGAERPLQGVSGPVGRPPRAPKKK
ncbi:ribosomal RNA small subunit methyltransferase C-like [Nilaparvata lugens]|uniref:ribosomal RNA small subunit methyltransferase C-like n=1 Tax=Nilaparvata lugens TaxID=108931 RepID=UPI00193D20C0|nr:ribosomal RNA small subunit methyltransferase C-like [Nilaparvata lugens]